MEKKCVKELIGLYWKRYNDTKIEKTTLYNSREDEIRNIAFVYFKFAARDAKVSMAFPFQCNMCRTPRCYVYRIMSRYNTIGIPVDRYRSTFVCGSPLQ